MFAKLARSWDLVKASAAVLKADFDVLTVTNAVAPSAETAIPAGKRETAVRIVHLPTGLAAHSDTERLQERNKEKALDILKAKLYCRQEEEKLKKDTFMKLRKSLAHVLSQRLFCSQTKFRALAVCKS